MNQVVKNLKLYETTIVSIINYRKVRLLLIWIIAD